MGRKRTQIRQKNGDFCYELTFRDRYIGRFEERHQAEEVLALLKKYIPRQRRTKRKKGLD